MKSLLAIVFSLCTVAYGLGSTEDIKTVVKIQTEDGKSAQVTLKKNEEVAFLDFFRRFFNRRGGTIEIGPDGSKTLNFKKGRDGVWYFSEYLKANSPTDSTVAQIHSAMSQLELGGLNQTANNTHGDSSSSK